MRILECPHCHVVSRPRVERPRICWACGYRYKDKDFEIEEKAAGRGVPHRPELVIAAVLGSHGVLPP